MKNNFQRMNWLLIVVNEMPCRRVIGSKKLLDHFAETEKCTAAKLATFEKAPPDNSTVNNSTVRNLVYVF